MAFETPITAKEAVENIHSRKYLLPAIQRELVWNPLQIENLFDSLMRGYPIGSFLFWFLNKGCAKNYEFYEFTREYSEFNSKHNPKVSNTGNKDIISILDGQQRLTALYIGLMGTYSYKIARKKQNDPLAYPIRKLYLNLRDSLSKEDNREYNFQFLTKEQAKENDENTYWFEVGKILSFEEYQVNDYLINNGLMNGNKEKSIFANRTLFRLHSAINKEHVINFYLEKSEELDKVLNIFIRVNNGGTRLNYTDLLLSMATAQWKDKDAREEINRFVDEINKTGDGFNFDKDLILRSCLVLSDVNNINFKVDNFKKENMLLIEQKWDDISEAIRLAISLVSSFGYTRETLTSHTSIIPIAYYLLKIGLPSNFEQSLKYKENRTLIKKWLIRSLLKKVFGAHPENLYRAIREIITENVTKDLFPLTKIIEKFKGAEKSISFDEDEIENLFFYKYSQPYTFSALSMLYPTLNYRNKFHVDHIFPKSFFKRSRLIKMGVDSLKIDFYLDNYNNLSNLQLLEQLPNQEKSDMDFKEWVDKTYSTESEKSDYFKNNFIPNNIDLDISNFEEFIIERRKLMVEKYKEII